MGNENGKDAKDKIKSSDNESRLTESSSESAYCSDPPSPLSKCVPQEFSSQSNNTSSPSSVSDVTNIPLPSSESGNECNLCDDERADLQVMEIALVDDVGSRDVEVMSELEECLKSFDSEHRDVMDAAQKVSTSGDVNHMEPAGIEVSLSGSGMGLELYDLGNGTVESNAEVNGCYEAHPNIGEASDSKCHEVKLDGSDTVTGDTTEDLCVSEEVSDDFQHNKESSPSVSPSAMKDNSIELEEENIELTVSDHQNTVDPGKPNSDVTSSCLHNNNEMDFVHSMKPQNETVMVETETALSVPNEDSDSEGMDCEFSLSDIDDVVDELEPAKEVTGSVEDATKLDSDVGNDQSHETTSVWLDQSSGSSPVDVGQSCATGLVEPDQSEAKVGSVQSADGYESEHESENDSERDFQNKSEINTEHDSQNELELGLEHRTDCSCGGAKKVNKCDVNTNEVTQSVKHELTKDSKSETERDIKLSVNNAKEKQYKAKPFEISPVTPDAEDRIDKVCALLNKYKAGKAAKNSQDKESKHPAGSSATSDDRRGTHNEEHTWKLIETSDSHTKSDRSWTGEENDSQFPVHDFEQMNDEAEHRIAARQAARRTAREIRMREIERQQREAEEKEGKILNKSTPSKPLLTSRYATSRQDSEDTDDMQLLKKELYELDERYTKAMMDNAQLDNDKQMLRYEVDLLKDRLEDLSEEHLELQREHKDKCRECDQKKRENTDLTEEVGYLKLQLQQRDKLIEDYGLVFISNDTLVDEADKDHRRQISAESSTTALVTPEAAEILKKHGEGGLDERLKQFDDDKKQLKEEIKKLKQLLDEEKERCALAEKYSTPPRVSQVSNGPDISELQMETQRMLNDYKFKLKKAQQDITTLEGNVIRLESQAKRYKQAAENSERNEEELKSEKRKLQRELREAQSEIEELQTSNQHLQKRLDKMKSARNAILKS